MSRADSRIPYGFVCTWWDSIDKVGRNGILPCCPHCQGMLFEMESEKAWFDGVDAYEASGNPGYRAMIEWGRGKCFPNYDALKSAYAARTVS